MEFRRRSWLFSDRVGAWYRVDVLRPHTIRWTMTSKLPAPHPPRLLGAWLLGALLLGGCVPVNRYPSVTVDRDAERRAAESPTSLDKVGIAALRSNDMATASSFFARALDLAPGDESAALGGAQAAAMSGNGDKAVSILRNAAPHANGESRSSLYAALGKLLVLNHRPAEAETTFRDGLRSAPHSVRLLTGLGVALAGQRRFAEAERSFRDALDQSPNDLPARNDLALSIALAGDPDAALRALRALRSEVDGTGADKASIETIDGNIALVRAMTGDVVGAGTADVRAAGDDADPARNTAFYSALARLQRPGSSSGLTNAGAGGAD